jgi:hypothetical protein
VLGAFGGLGVFASLRRSPALCFLCLALFPPVFGHASFATFSVIFEAKSSRRLAKDFAALPATTELVCLECFPNGLAFYLGRTMTVFSKDGRELTSNYITYSIERTKNWPAKVRPLSELNSWLSSRQGSVYLIAPLGRREKLTAIAEAAGAKVESLSSGYLGAKLYPQEGH